VAPHGTRSWSTSDEGDKGRCEYLLFYSCFRKPCPLSSRFAVYVLPRPGHPPCSLLGSVQRRGEYYIYGWSQCAMLEDFSILLVLADKVGGMIHQGVLVSLTDFMVAICPPR